MIFHKQRSHCRGSGIDLATVNFRVHANQVLCADCGDGEDRVAAVYAKSTGRASGDTSER